MTTTSESGMGGSADALMGSLADFIRARPEMRMRLLREHINDGSDHCGRCGGGGQTGRYVWPCTIRIAALAARDSRNGRSTGATRTH